MTGVRYEAQTESHRVIEMLMILANEQVAGYLADRGSPTLYRVHERPDPQSVVFLAEQLASLDIPTPPLPKQMTPQQAADAVTEISRIVARESGGQRAYGVLVLRALKQAYYSPRNIGHAGLASARYCHFTSPIRRYPDIVAHRALLQGLGIDEAATPAHELEEAGVLSSSTEREAMKIERDADDVCLAFLLQRVLSEAGSDDDPPSFEGEVVGLIEKGAFVAVRRGALRGLPAGAAAARLVDAERGRDGARGGGLRAPAAARATRSRSRSSGSTRRAAAWISSPPSAYSVTDG